MSGTIQQSLSGAIAQLRQQLPTVDTIRLDAELLLAFTLQQSRTWLKTWPEKTLNPEQSQRFQSFIERRGRGEPVAYIVGKQDFWTLSLKVTTDTLIPRPETELLVELALDLIKNEPRVTIADLGTGSGAIALAIASERPQAQVIALDLSQKALQVAEFNRQQLAIENVCCQQGHWLRDWQGGELDMVVSNPPYIAHDDQHLQDLGFEPESALVSEREGLADIIEITEQARVYLKPAGWLLFEHGFEQGQAVQQILLNQNFSQVQTIKDYAGLDRVTLGCKPKALN